MKKTIAKNGKRMLEKLIFQARKSLVEPGLDPSRDSLIMSWATYSPWLLDKEFQSCYATIKDYTLVDLYRSRLLLAFLLLSIYLMSLIAA